MDPTKIRGEGVSWIYLAQDTTCTSEFDINVLRGKKSWYPMTKKMLRRLADAATSPPPLRAM